MKITVTKVKRELIKKHGWLFLGSGQMEQQINAIIKDTLKVVDEQLRAHKNITILGK